MNPESLVWGAPTYTSIILKLGILLYFTDSS